MTSHCILQTHQKQFLLKLLIYQVTALKAAVETNHLLYPLYLLSLKYSHQSHYFYMLLRDDCFLSIKNRASASFQFPIVDLYLPLWECYIVISCDRDDWPNILYFSCFFLILTRCIDFLETMDCLRCCHLKFCYLDNEWSSCF